ncbi:Mce-associated membrane protein [Thermocatellispora tengchongensis]|uniref:Mce-associated membrane protein n=1 Tax=Thermocatellispora tengchongensis TaxID=1073253 RepID=A0A840PI73_9ACTN|nr:hypothetical protein [Thermocatellispora tengchongensis]MBB5138679.1 Mce-associated membrane protein [Thermocatellispora tengchongensis]
MIEGEVIEGARAGRPRSRAFLVGVTFLTLLAVTLGGVVAVAYANLRWLRESDSAGAEAMATARSVAADMLSYDYRTVEADLARAQGYTTGELAGHYRTLARSLAPQARKERAVQQASVVAAGIESAEPDRVRVLLFVDMATSKVAPGEREPRQRRELNRARFVMVKQDSRWLVAELSTLLGSVSGQ